MRRMVRPSTLCSDNLTKISNCIRSKKQQKPDVFIVVIVVVDFESKWLNIPFENICGEFSGGLLLSQIIHNANVNEQNQTAKVNIADKANSPANQPK